MLAGHYSAAFLAKAASPRVPLWSLVLLVVLHAMSLVAPTPSSPAALVGLALVLYLVAVWLARRVDIVA